MMMPLDDQGRLNAAKGGKKGGPISPTNFRNNPALASRAGSHRQGSPWPKCPECGKKMSRAKLEIHLKEEHEW